MSLYRARAIKFRSSCSVPSVDAFYILCVGATEVINLLATGQRTPTN